MGECQRTIAYVSRDSHRGPAFSVSLRRRAAQARPQLRPRDDDALRVIREQAVHAPLDEASDGGPAIGGPHVDAQARRMRALDQGTLRSEEHTSELQSHSDLVCRLLL